jgi:hypothetical protein
MEDYVPNIQLELGLAIQLRFIAIRLNSGSPVRKV